MEIHDVDYIKFGPHYSISKDDKMELTKQLENLIASHENSEIVQKLKLSSIMTEYNPIDAKANQIKRAWGNRIEQKIRFKTFEEYSSKMIKTSQIWLN